MNFIQRQHIFIKLLFYLVIIFVAGLFLSILMAFFIPIPDGPTDWEFSLGFLLAFIITAIGAVMSEHNALQRMREKALATKNDLISIQTRIENTLFQLESLLLHHMEHETDIYLKVSKDDSRRYPKLRTMGEVRNSLSEFPALRSDETVMRLFNEIASSHNMLMNCKLSYNALASDYNAGIHKFPANLFQNIWGLSELPYLNAEDDTLVRQE